MTFTCFSLLGKANEDIIFSEGLSIINTGLLKEVNLDILIVTLIPEYFRAA